MDIVDPSGYLYADDTLKYALKKANSSYIPAEGSVPDRFALALAGLASEGFTAKLYRKYFE